MISRRKLFGMLAAAPLVPLALAVVAVAAPLPGRHFLAGGMTYVDTEYNEAYAEAARNIISRKFHLSETAFAKRRWTFDLDVRTEIVRQKDYIVRVPVR